jgi:hypothetical protein
MTPKGAWLRGTLTVGAAAAAYAAGVHVWDHRAYYGLIAAVFIAVRGFIDSSWGDRSPKS